MASVVLDFNSISEEDIKKATEQLSKQISTEVNNAMKLGLTGSLNIYSKTVGTYVSIALKDSLLKVLNEDLAKQFSDFMSKKVFGEGFARSIKSSLEDAFKTLPAFKVNVVPVIKPDSMAPVDVASRPVGDSTPVPSQFKGGAGNNEGLGRLSESSLEDAFKTLPAFKVNVVPVIKPDSMAPVDVASRPVGDSTPVPSQFKGGAGNNEGLGRLSESSLDLVASQALLLNAQNKAVESLTQMAEQLDKAIEKQKDLTKEHEEALDTQKKKKTEEKAEAGVEAEQGVAGKPKKPGIMESMGTSLKLAATFWVGQIVSSLTKTVKDTVGTYIPRQREALTSAGTVVPSAGLAQSPQTYMRFSKELKQGMEHSPLLKQFGGENAFKEFMNLKGITGGFKPQDLEGGSNKAKEAMETMAAKAILAGMNLDEFAKKTQEGILKFGMNQERSEKFFLGLADKAKLLDVPLENLYSNINSANGSIRIWGHSLSESYGIATRFSKSLEQGTISMGTIIDFATALHKTGEGESMFLMDMMSRMDTAGSGIARAIQEKSGGDPLAMRTLFRKASEGYEGISKELGLKQTDADIQKLLRQGGLQAVSGMAKDMSPDNVNAQAELLRKFLPILGITGDISQRNLELMMNTYSKGKGPSDWTPNEKKRDEDVSKIAETMKDLLGPIDSATLYIKDAAITFSDKVYDLFTPGKKKERGLEQLGMLKGMVESGDETGAVDFAANMKKEGFFSGGGNILSDTVKTLSELVKDDVKVSGLSAKEKAATSVYMVALGGSVSQKDVDRIAEQIQKGVFTQDTLDTIMDIVDKNKKVPLTEKLKDSKPLK